ncbi:GNAT family N-acetyltransferase [Saccharopolyspora erythraea]|uniref:GNAT family N-acetyltransferase n=1 Tax=Saccharopolyspora erythraea TaxID=1836 RepID=UPI001BA4E26E|nr:GNAT family N-acetyltransferase [Saccharopolyspora erythraea]QUH04606.1 GNAT family N-acetyltransferase [Saccharopolyspora erythraea]
MTTPPSTITVRPVGPDDFEAVADLTARAYVDGGHLSADDGYVRRLRDVADRARRAELLVAVEGGRVLGSVTLARGEGDYANIARRGEMEFRMLAVAPEASGRGVGRALVRAVVDRARVEGHERVVLTSQASMTVAHGLYERFGFRRAPDRDWEPEPGLHLMAYVLELS